jgi:hypothetical protein
MIGVFLNAIFILAFAVVKEDEKDFFHKDDYS